ELAQSGVRANAICPGITETDMVSTMPDYVSEMQKQSACLGKNADVKDIANTAMFLLSDYSSYITGQAIRVDGGVLEYYKR
ncbi:MAG: SDR family oxidoreductase, partial [Candidatus Methanomethylophilaceae archaeon]|nr:SDR family oxidoreductase [Candidatus Methanomethylophilaceae archaeon]